MKHKLAKITSVVFHPVIFILLIPFLVVYRGTADVLYGLKWLIFVCFFLFASLFVFFLLQPVEFLTDFDISNRQKRPIFYTVGLLFAILFFLAAISLKGIFFPLTIVSLGIILGIIIFELANFYLKVSIHNAVVTAFAITFGILFGYWAFVVFAWLPILMIWSRVTLKKHTFLEALTGCILGAVVTMLTFAIAKMLL
ncbi:MAG TPA: hypothetical protein VF820_06300 [Patescibacteria group bacterium]